MRSQAIIPPRDLRLGRWLVTIVVVTTVAIGAILARRSPPGAPRTACPDGMLGREIVGGYRVCQPPSIGSARR